MSVMAITAALSACMVFIAMKMAQRKGMVDIPGDRQSHTVPTPTGGGAGIVIALILSSLVLAQGGSISRDWLLAVLPGLAILSVLGWLDDQRPLSAVVRLFVQLAVSFALLFFLAISGRFNGWLLIVPGGIAMVWVLNFYNFMDGSDGMAGFQGVFCGLVLGAGFIYQGHTQLAIPAFLLAAACAGFLPLNFPVPHVFMGDAGSVPLGFAISALMVLGLVHDALILPVAVLVLSVFLVDSSLTLLSRAIRGEQWYTAHKQHVYQRLIDQGWPHSRVLFLYQAINLILVTPAILLAWMYPEYAWPATGFLYLLLISGWHIASLRLGMRK